jgi:predicted P-loop ATPase
MIVTNFKSRKDTVGQQVLTDLYAFTEVLRYPRVTPETMEQYAAMTKDERLDVKDVGGFIQGAASEGVSPRSKGAMGKRELLVFDVDGAAADFLERVDQLGFAYILHSTHSSTPDCLRLRLMVVLEQPITANAYSKWCAAFAAKYLADELHLDRTGFTDNHLMFYPSIPSDAEYVFRCRMPMGKYRAYTSAEYGVDQAAMPKVSRAHERAAGYAQGLLEVRKQADPTEKKGIEGAFCRAYSVPEAIDRYLSDTYTRVSDDRYTFAAGTSTGGLLIYDGGKFAYSFHDTDPTRGKLCNAFDLVRLHLFGTRGYDKMVSLANDDDRVLEQMQSDTLAIAAEAEHAFMGVYDDWTQALDRGKGGSVKPTGKNVMAIFTNDLMLKDTFELDTFDQRVYVKTWTCWCGVAQQDFQPYILRDSDYAGLYMYFEMAYGITNRAMIDDGLKVTFQLHSHNSLQEYLTPLTWDGTPRLATMLHDYFGCAADEYSSMIFKKFAVGAVKRGMEPGCKVDNVMVLVGAQRIAKSAFFAKLGGAWFSDTFNTFTGKEAYEQIQGKWIIEIAELSAMKGTGVEKVKQYITKQTDNVRLAYARTVQEYKRQCVFVGTTNEVEFLSDPTGNRRFLPIFAKPMERTKTPFDEDFSEVRNQVWAEAMDLYRKGYPAFLNEEENVLAEQQRSPFVELDVQQSSVELYLNTLLPKDWYERSLYDRQQYFIDPTRAKAEGVVRRDFVSPIEIWCECMQQPREKITNRESRQYNDLMQTLRGWQRAVGFSKRTGCYGTQRGFTRKGSGAQAGGVDESA